MKQYTSAIAALPLESIKEIFAPVLERIGAEIETENSIQFLEHEEPNYFTNTEFMVNHMIGCLADESEEIDAMLSFERESQ